MSTRKITLIIVAINLFCGAAIALILYLHYSNVNRRISSIKPNEGGYTLLHLACREGNVEEARSLLQRGADPNIRDDYKRTALYWAINSDNTQGNLECMELLLQSGADPNIPDKLGRTPLHCAAYLPRIEKILFLLDHGANPNAVNRWQNTALHDFCIRARARDLETRAQHLNAMWRLLLAGARPEMKDEDGKTVREYLIQARQFDLVFVLDAWQLAHHRWLR